jgi:mono/diheme cytochrome c family protein
MTNKLRWFLLGVLLLPGLVLIAGVIVANQVRGFSTREPPTFVEQWLARAARSAAVPAAAKTHANPVPDIVEVISEARAHWADHCALCHANDGSGDTEMGRQMYPPAPDMRQAATQRLSDGELFYIIQNGIRLTGMPSWGSGSSHDEEASWKLVRFIRHLPHLTMEERKQMEKLNPKGPDDRLEEEQEEKFLRGEGTDVPPTQDQHQHHH